MKRDSERTGKDAPTTGTISIGELSQGAGVNTETIRYYERAGLMPKAARSGSGYRLYNDKHRDRLVFIRHSRELGFALDDIRELLALSDDPESSCESADRIASAHLREVEAKLASLEVLRKELRRMVKQCRHQRIADCKVIHVLADHAQCAHDHGKPETVAHAKH